MFCHTSKTDLKTETEISGARFHRAEHVINVLHARKTTVNSAPVLSCFVLLVAFCGPAPAAETKPPHIIFAMADDKNE